MKRFIKNFCLWLFVGASIALAFDWFLVRGIWQIQNGDIGVHNTVFSGKANAEFLILGSSRASSNYHTPELAELSKSSWFNIGQDGEEANIHFAYLRAYLSMNAKPKCLVYNIDPWALGPFERTYDNIRYVPYLANRIFYDEMKEIDSSIWQYGCIPMYKFIGRPKLVLKGALGNFGMADRFVASDRELGFHPGKTNTLDVQKARDFDSKRNPKSWYDFETGGESEDYVVKIIDICTENKIPIVFCISPMWHERQSISTNGGIVMDHLTQMCQLRGVPFKSYLASDICAREDCFADSWHLNEHGARIFAADFLKWFNENRSETN